MIGWSWSISIQGYFVFILRVYQKHMLLVDKNRLQLMLMLMMLMMLKNRSSLSSSLALAKAKAASINWMQLLTDLQASLQICRSSGSTSKLMLFMIELMEQALSKLCASISRPCLAKSLYVQSFEQGYLIFEASSELLLMDLRFKFISPQQELL